MKTLIHARLTEQQIAQVQDIVMEELDVKREQLTPGARLVEDLGADSIEVVQIAMRAEEVFHVTLSDEATGKGMTMETLYEVLADELGR